MDLKNLNVQELNPQEMINIDGGRVGKVIRKIAHEIADFF